MIQILTSFESQAVAGNPGYLSYDGNMRPDSYFLADETIDSALIVYEFDTAVVRVVAVLAPGSTVCFCNFNIPLNIYYHILIY